MADGCERTIEIAVSAAPSALAQAAADFPARACSCHADDIEIGALRIAPRYERDLAEKFIGAVVATFGLHEAPNSLERRRTGVHRTCCRWRQHVHPIPSQFVADGTTWIRAIMPPSSC